MTATGRQDDPRSWPVAERSLLPSVLGIAPWAAVLVALGLTALGVLGDVLRIGTVGLIFQVCYFAGCVLAVGWVRRAQLFAPVVAPPLILAVVVPTVVLLVGPGPAGAGIAQQLLLVGAPMVNAFPTMAFTVGAVLLVALVRLVVQRPGRDGPAAPAPDRVDPVSRPPGRGKGRSGAGTASGRGAARGVGRRSGSPGRS